VFVSEPCPDAAECYYYYLIFSPHSPHSPPEPARQRFKRWRERWRVASRLHFDSIKGAKSALGLTGLRADGAAVASLWRVGAVDEPSAAERKHTLRPPAAQIEARLLPPICAPLRDELQRILRHPPLLPVREPKPAPRLIHQLPPAPPLQLAAPPLHRTAVQVLVPHQPDQPF